MDKAPDAFRTISEVASELDIPQHVLRFWETRFTQIKPMKRSGGRRYYRPDDVDLLKGIRRLLYGRKQVGTFNCVYSHAFHFDVSQPFAFPYRPF